MEKSLKLSAPHIPRPLGYQIFNLMLIFYNLQVEKKNPHNFISDKPQLIPQISRNMCFQEHQLMKYQTLKSMQ